MNNRNYQYGFSATHPEAMFNPQARERKAATILAVLRDYFSVDLESLTLLDIGTSAGFMANYLSSHFAKVIGIDIDLPAVLHAVKTSKKKKLLFAVADSLNICLPDEVIDVAICTHVYEHVPNAIRLMEEIHRVLKPNGICYFAAGNRMQLIEPHYHLPLLSVVPRPLAHLYIRLAGKGKFYYEKHLSYWKLKRLVHKFELIDYTRLIVDNPSQFSATYMLEPGATKTKIAQWVVKHAFWLCPSYIWILKKL